jgi:hypothetical protein
VARLRAYARTEPFLRLDNSRKSCYNPHTCSESVLSSDLRMTRWLRSVKEDGRAWQDAFYCSLEISIRSISARVALGCLRPRVSESRSGGFLSAERGQVRPWAEQQRSALLDGCAVHYEAFVVNHQNWNAETVSGLILLVGTTLTICTAK